MTTASVGFLQKLEAWETMTESKVAIFVAKVEAGLAWVEHEAELAYAWCVKNAPAFVADVQTVEDLLPTVLALFPGGKVPAAVLAAAQEAQKLSAAATTLINDNTASVSTAQTVADMYKTMTAASSAGASALSSLINASATAAPAAAAPAVQAA